MKSLLLDRDTWDLCLDAHGNLAVASEPYAILQDVACAVRTFSGECWYDTSLGIPYFEQVLGQFPPLTLFKQLIVDAALSVPGVASATCFVASVEGRSLTGQIQVTTIAGDTGAVGFGGAGGVFVLGNAASPVGSAAHGLG